MTRIQLINGSASYRISQRLTFKSLIKNVPAKTIKALTNISFEINEHEYIGLIGKNGSGKSTLLKVLSGNLPLRSGQLIVNGEVLSILQRTAGLLPKASLRDNAYFKGAFFGLKSDQLLGFIEKCLIDAELQERKNDPLNSLSTGMASRFNMVLNAQFVKPITIFDEWIGTNDFSQSINRGILKRIRDKAKIIVIASHNESLIRKLCNRLIVLNNGEILYDGKDMDDGFKVMKKQAISDQPICEDVTNGEKSEDVINRDNKEERNIRRNLIIASSEKLHFINIGGLTCHSSLKHFTQNISPDSYNLVFHRPGTKLINVPLGEKCFFFVSDPIERFLSAFYLRKRKGSLLGDPPRFDREKEVFIKFDKPNTLAEALDSEAKKTRFLAFKAMTTIINVNSSYWDWFRDKSYFLSRKDDIFFIGSCENYYQDVNRLKSMLGLEADLSSLSNEEIFVPENDEDLHLSDSAKSNLRQWYAPEYEFIDCIHNLGLG